MEQSKPTNHKKSRAWFNFVGPIVIALLIAIPFHNWTQGYFDTKISSLWRMLLFVSIYFVINWLFGILFNNKKKDKKLESTHPGLKWPVNGPLARFGFLPIYLVFVPTSMLFMLNPFQWVLQLRQIRGQINIANRIDGEEQAFEDYQTKIDYRLPFNGQWLIFQGGLTEDTSHSWEVLTQRYAYDFVKVDECFARHENRGTKLKDYYCYAQPIVAAADGEVVTVKDGIGDAPFVGFYFADFMTRHIAGNHVIIKHADGEYGFYAHLIKGSIDSKPGDKVIAGQTIGLCGHSGNSSEPHLHFHLQDRADFFTAMGLPIRFSNIAVDDVTSDDRPSIERGQKVKYL